MVFFASNWMVCFCLLSFIIVNKSEFCGEGSFLTIQGKEKESKIEAIKRQSRYLRGTIKEALQDGKPMFSEEDIQVLKFHGVYQQDDRDLRSKLVKEGKEKHYSMMIRARIRSRLRSYRKATTASMSTTTTSASWRISRTAASRATPCW
jgi:sulfite reductase beta subunit-like hemoprotein